MRDVERRELADGRIRRRRKRNMSLYYATVAFIALVIFAILSVTVFFNVENIIVTGSSIYTAEEIVDASGINGGDNMIRRNMGRVEKKITEQLVYIENAEVTRRFPSSLEIFVSPCQETACLSNGDDGYWIVSKTGKILTDVEEPPAEMPVFYGTEPAEEQIPGMTFASGDEHKTEVIYELMKRIESNFGSKITSYDVTDRLNISCMYEDRVEIQLGVISDIDYKFRLAYEILSTRISSDAEGRLRMLENGAQFLSRSDLEQIEENFIVNLESSVIEENSPEESETSVQSDGSETTKLNFE